MKQTIACAVPGCFSRFIPGPDATMLDQIVQEALDAGWTETMTYKDGIETTEHFCPKAHPINRSHPRKKEPTTP